MKACILGGGVIGGGWAARFLMMGWDVVVCDPDPEAERKIGEVLGNARRALPSLYDAAMPAEGVLSFDSNIASAVADVDWVQESVPERLELKHKVLETVTSSVKAGCVIGSSTSGFKPSELQEGVSKGEQILVTHPFNPVYLLPVVEVVPSPETSAGIVEKAQVILDDIGMKPLLIKKEIDAHVADRLLEAVWREGLWLIHDDIATTQEIDDVIRFGFGLRWAQMGLFETYRVAGGEAGMEHFIGQFGPCLQWPWTKLMDVPELTPELTKKIADQSDAQSGHLSIRELERARDDNLVGMMRALKVNDWGAGALLKAMDQKMTALDASTADAGLVETVKRAVPQSWTDYNNHMNEAHYLEIFAQATDNLMIMVGADADYIASGNSYFTVETHIRHLDECVAGDTVRVLTQVLNGTGKKMHLFHQLVKDDGTVAATGEHMLIHVNLDSRAACVPVHPVSENLPAMEAAHAKLPAPDGMGRAIGSR